MGRVANHSSYRNTVMHGENISIQCTRNFELEGNVTQIMCNNGTFNRMPRCEPARCKTLPSPPNDGMVVVSCCCTSFPDTKSCGLLCMPHVSGVHRLTSIWML